MGLQLMHDHTLNMTLVFALATLAVVTQQPGQLFQVLGLALGMALIWAAVLAPFALLGKARRWVAAPAPARVTAPSQDFSWFFD